MMMRSTRLPHRPRVGTMGVFWISLALVPLAAADWPQWRGPQRDGVASGSVTPADWPGELQPAWRVTVGTGHASPVVASGHVYVHARQGADEVVRALRLDDGVVVWEQRYPVKFKAPMGSGRHGAGPKASPVVADARLFTVGVNGVLSAWATDDGRLLWRRDFRERFGKLRPHFGAASSPLVEGETLIGYFGGGKDFALMAFDAETGEERWSLPLDGASYASPIVAELDGVRQVVALTADDAIGVDVTDGKRLWGYPFPDSMSKQNIVTPVVSDGRVIVSGERRGIVALRPTIGDDGWTVARLWQLDELAMDMSSPVSIDGALYGLSHRDKGRLFCITIEEGQTAWDGEPRTANFASLAATGDRLLVLTSDAELIVLDPSPEAYRETVRYSVADSPTWAPIVPLAHGLLVKDRESLARLDWD